MTVRLKNQVTRVPTLPCEQAIAHFERRFALETDCWDVHAAQELPDPEIVLVDVRSAEAFDGGHVPGAISIPHWQLNESRLSEFAPNTLFVVYCAGPHCNGSTKGALRIAQSGRRVKEMIGGVTGWLDEGFQLEGAEVS